MPLVPVRGADGGTYQLDMVLGPAGGYVPSTPIEGDEISKGGLTSSSSSQVLAAANSSRSKIDISNAGDSDVYLAFHASNGAVAGQGRLLPGRAQGTYYSRSRVSVVNETGGSNCAVSYSEFG